MLSSDGLMLDHAGQRNTDENIDDNIISSSISSCLIKIILRDKFNPKQNKAGGLEH